MKSPKLKYQDLMYAIKSELPIFLKHFAHTDEYRPILNVLKKEFPSLDDFPYQKDLLQHLGMSRPALMSRLHDLYRDFHTTMCEEGAYPISKTVIYLHISTLNDHWMIGVQGLEKLPRPGDYFSVDFIKDEIGYVNCYVTDVNHELEGGVHSIYIHMKHHLLLKKEGKMPYI